MEEIEKGLQEKVLLYQLLQKYADGLREQMAFLEKQMIDIATSQQAIEEWQKAKSNQEMLIGLGAGCWSSVKLQKEKHLLVNLGAGVLARQGPEQALKILESRTSEIHKEADRIQSEFMAIGERLMGLEEEIERSSK